MLVKWFQIRVHSYLIIVTSAYIISAKHIKNRIINYTYENSKFWNQDTNRNHKSNMAVNSHHMEFFGQLPNSINMKLKNISLFLGSFKVILVTLLKWTPIVLEFKSGKNYQEVVNGWDWHRTVLDGSNKGRHPSCWQSHAVYYDDEI